MYVLYIKIEFAEVTLNGFVFIFFFFFVNRHETLHDHNCAQSWRLNNMTSFGHNTTDILSSTRVFLVGIIQK